MTVGATPPVNPLDEMWYLGGDTEALGPYSGRDIAAMIERGSIGAQTWIAKAGASQWSTLADVPAFARVLRGVPAGPSAPSGPARATAADAARPIHFAGFWIRVVAYIVDQVVIVVIFMAVSVVIGVVFGLALAARGRPAPEATTVLIGLVYVAEIVILVAYQMIFLSSRWQATPGKRLCGICVIRTDGRKIGPGLALGRYLCWWLSAIILYVGLIMVAFTKQKKGLHDIMCNTRVIYGRAQDIYQIAEIFD